MKKKTQHGAIAIYQKRTQNGSKNRIHRKLWLLNEAMTTMTAAAASAAAAAIAKIERYTHETLCVCCFKSEFAYE